MNYRHIYHAGNFADVMKHLAMLIILDHLKKKDSPFCVIDAHGGIGIYDLMGEQAQKTREWEDGVGRLSGLTDTSEDLSLYTDIIAPYMGKHLYPGSPLLAAHMLRANDRMIANELHPEDVETLKDTLYDFRNARVTHLDAYECIRANIPPPEKRGIVLIDPPFEKTDEFETLARQMEEWKKRFANGIFIIWYPIKSHLAVDAMKNAARELGLPRTWCLETLRHSRTQEGTFNGSGLIVFNTPYQVPERIEAILPLLEERLGLLESEREWLTPA